MHDIYKQKCLVKSIYLVLQIKHCKKVRSSIGFNSLLVKDQWLDDKLFLNVIQCILEDIFKWSELIII